MGITPDGDRSRERLWFAKKLLSKIEMLDLPGSALVYDGFKFIVNKIGDIVTGRVMAPMGAVVTCTGSTDGLQDQFTNLCVADYWLSSFLPRGYWHVLDYPTSGIVSISLKGNSQETMEAAGFSTLQATFVSTANPYPPSKFPGGPYVSIKDRMPTPLVLPFKGGEAFWMCHAGRYWNDVNDDDYPDSTELEQKFESMVNHYSSTSASMNNRITFFQKVNYADSSMRIWQTIPASAPAFVNWHTNIAYDPSSGIRKIATYYFWNTSEEHYSGQWLLNDMDVDLPSELQDDIEEPYPGTTSVKPIGSYAFALEKDSYPTLLHCVDLTNTNPWHEPTAPEEVYFGNPANDEKWRLFYIINTIPETGSANVHTVDSSNFLPLLDTLQGGGVGTTPATADWDLARQMMAQFFPLPNYNAFAPSDSSMIHDKDGNIYTWTRTYGAVQFSTSGMSQPATFEVPAETGTDFVRPTMYYCGIDARAIPKNLYLCVCEDMRQPHTVYAVYYGHPFTAIDPWTKLPDPDAGFHLVHVRPVRVQYDEQDNIDIILLGVMEDETNPGYNFALLEYNDGVGNWRILGRLPVEHGDYYSWSVGLFGEGSIAAEMQEFLDPPPALPQMPPGPTNYSDYEQP